MAKQSKAGSQSKTQDSIATNGFEADLVVCRVALVGHLFYSTQIPECLWFIRKNGNANASIFGLN